MIPQRSIVTGSPAPTPNMLPYPSARLPPMSPMVPNRRSVSRGASLGRSALEGTPLGSPMPMYPRRRSVTFVDDEERGLREERPEYITEESAVKMSHRPVSDDERTTQRYEAAQYEYLSDSSRTLPPSIMVNNKQEEQGSAFQQQRAPSHFAGRSLPPTPRKALMTPTRRSASRQRLENRRQEAMVNHSFYDDSFIEEFVGNTRDEMERKIEEERREVEMKLEEERRALEEAARARAALERERERERVEAAQLAAQLSTLSTVVSHQSSRLHNTSGVEDNRALLARLRAELSTSDKPYIDMTPRKSQRNSVAAQPQQQQLPIVAASKRVDSRAASIMIHYPSASENETDGNPDDYNTEDERAPVHKRQQQRAPAVKPVVSVSRNRGGRAESIGTKKKTDRIESLIREAMTNYRKNKKAGSVMVIDLDDIDNGGASESEAPTPEEPKQRPQQQQRRAVSKAGAVVVAASAPQTKARSVARVVQLEEPPVIVQRGGGAKRGRAAEPAVIQRATSNRNRVDSRPRFDDESSGGDNQPDDQDDMMSDGDRPVLLQRNSRTIAAKTERQSSRRIEADVDHILSMGNRPAPVAAKTVPRAPPPPRPAARGTTAAGRGRKKDVVVSDDDEPLPVHRATPFAAPYVEPTLTRSAVARAATAPAPTAAIRSQKAKQNHGDAFAHFEFQFDSPAKFDEPVMSTVGATVKTSRQNGNSGLMLATSCRSRRR